MPKNLSSQSANPSQILHLGSILAPHHQLPTHREEQLPGNIVLTDTVDHEGVLVNNWFLF